MNLVRDVFHIRKMCKDQSSRGSEGPILDELPPLWVANRGGVLGASKSRNNLGIDDPPPR